MRSNREVYILILKYLLQFRQTAVSVEDANTLLENIEKSRLDLSPRLYKSLIDFYSSFLQILPCYCAWFQYTAECRKQSCSTYEKTRKSFLDFVSDGPAYFLVSVSEEKMFRFFDAFRDQYDRALRLMAKNPELSSWLSPSDQIFETGADMLYDMITQEGTGE